MKKGFIALSVTFLLLVVSANAQTKRTLKNVGKVLGFENPITVDSQTLERSDAGTQKTVRLSVLRTDAAGQEGHAAELSSSELNDVISEVSSLVEKTKTESPKLVAIEYYVDSKNGLRISAYTQANVWKYSVSFRDPDGSRYSVVLQPNSLNDLITLLKAAAQDL